MEETRGIMPGGQPSLPAQLRQMLKAIAQVRSEPRLHDSSTLLTYKLDPGEPGLLRSATPEESTAAVSTQEQANAHRLAAEAMARGEDVVSVDITYKRSVVGGKVAMKAGHTEVVSIKRDKTDAAADVYRANREAAFSLGLLDLGDDAGLRSLYGGLTPEDD
jgi:hypothetical protein